MLWITVFHTDIDNVENQSFTRVSRVRNPFHTAKKILHS
jgi:hypothetical protein